jgi:anti-sigma factor RsiW
MTDPSRAECAAILSNISAFLDGELDATACADIEAHCARCARCAPIVEGLRRTIGLCHQAAAAPLPDHVRALAQDLVKRLLKDR